jgi:hypothetical protein
MVRDRGREDLVWSLGMEEHLVVQENGTGVPFLD